MNLSYYRGDGTHVPMVPYQSVIHAAFLYHELSSQLLRSQETSSDLLVCRIRVRYVCMCEGSKVLLYECYYTE